MKICSIAIEEYEKMVVAFHGSLAPGLLIGGFMVDLANKNLPKGEFFDVICETQKCIPDAVQLLTPCSIGNGWLKILDVGRFAMTFFNKYTGDGVRIYLDLKKIENWEEIKSWFFKLKPKNEQNSNLLFNQIKQAGTEILSMQKVVVGTNINKKKKGAAVSICPVCNEGYPAADGDKCKICSNEITYYSLRP